MHQPARKFVAGELLAVFEASGAQAAFMAARRHVVVLQGLRKAVMRPDCLPTIDELARVGMLDNGAAFKHRAAVDGMGLVFAAGGGLPRASLANEK